METYALSNTKKFDRFIRFDKKSSPLMRPILPIPFGSVHDTVGYEFFINMNKNKVTKIFAKGKNNKTITLYPNYLEEVTIKDKKWGDIKIELFLINNYNDLQNAQNLITQTHYLKAPHHGMYLGCRFVDPNIQKEIYHSAINKNNSQKINDIIGCVVLDTLYHGNPIGRKELLKKEKKDDLLKNWNINRKDIVSELKLSWISRIVVEKPYQNIGIGTILVKKMIVVAKENRIPQSKHIEVIRSVPKEIAEEIINQNRSDFLTRIGFVIVKELRNSKPILKYKCTRLDGIDGIEYESVKKIYYYL